jgi:hypothetical protein
MNRLSSGRMQEASKTTDFSESRSRMIRCNKAYGFCRKIMVLFVFIFFITIFSPTVLFGQSNRMVPPAGQKHSPRKATLYSAVLPGLGQAYNKKYWKIPIIYGGFGALFYMTRENTLEYRKFLEAYRYEVSDKSTPPPENDYLGRYNEQQLMSGKNLYRRNVEVGYILGGVLYILNIIDASVDAHLFYYDISEDLSMKLEPTMLSSPLAAKPVTGISLTIRF